MNKGANVGGGGPTAAAAAAAAQKQKSLLQRVDADIGNIVDNYGFIVNAARVCPHFLHLLPSTKKYRSPIKFILLSFSGPKTLAVEQVVLNFKLLCAIVVIKVS